MQYYGRFFVIPPTLKQKIMNTKKFHGGILMPCLFLMLISQIHAQVSMPSLQFTRVLKDFPAARCMLHSPYLSTSIHNDFCIKEMMFKELEFDFIHGQDALLASASHYGYSGFGELAVHLGYGRRFGNKVAVALRGVYLLNHATHYAPRHSFTVDFSAYCQISRTIGLAVCLYNPIRMKYGIKGDEIIPMVFTLQAAYQPSEKLLFALYGEKKLPGTLDAGLEMYYHPLPNLMVSGTAALTHCGIGVFVPWKQIIFSIEADWYYKVSVSPQYSLDYLFKKE